MKSLLAMTHSRAERMLPLIHEQQLKMKSLLAMTYSRAERMLLLIDEQRLNMKSLLAMTYSPRGLPPKYHRR